MLFRRILTYRLALYYLAAILATALVLSVFDIVHQNPLNLAFCTALNLVVCFVANGIFARVFGAKTNWESVLISGFIISLIITPVAFTDYTGMMFLVLTGTWAMASKYMLAVDKRHIFNPACFGAALVGVGLHQNVSWWVGDNIVLLPVIIAGGVLILMRLRYFEMVAAFAVVVLGIAVAEGSVAGALTSLSMMAVHSMFCFFAFVMLTEPRTAPLGRWRQIAYGGLVGFLFAPTTHIGTYYFTPEVALVCGNLFTFLTNRRRLKRWGEAFA